MAEAKKCANCGTIENLRRCNGCKTVSYCSVKCQTIHWKSNHKKQCKKLRNKTRQNQKKISKTKMNENENETENNNDDENDQKEIMWKCKVCGFDNNVRTKSCMVCNQLDISITAENSRPQ